MIAQPGQAAGRVRTFLTRCLPPSLCRFPSQRGKSREGRTDEKRFPPQKALLTTQSAKPTSEGVASVHEFRIQWHAVHIVAACRVTGLPLLRQCGGFRRRSVQLWGKMHTLQLNARSATDLQAPPSFAIHGNRFEPILLLTYSWEHPSSQMSCRTSCIEDGRLRLEIETHCLISFFKEGDAAVFASNPTSDPVAGH